MFDIEPATGFVCLEEEDFSLNGEVPFFFTRRYNNLSRHRGSLGGSWTHPYDLRLFLRDGEFRFIDGEAREVELTGLARSRRVELLAEDLVAEHLEKEVLLHQGEGKTLTFSKTSLLDGGFPLVRIDQTDENTIVLAYREGRLVEIQTSSFHRLRFEYNGRLLERILLIKRDGEDVPLATYAYTAEGQLAAVRDVENLARTYEYSGNLLTRYVNRMGGSFYIQYDRHGRATTVWQDGLSRYRRVLYDDRNGSRLLTDSLGRSTLLRYNENLLLVGAVLFDGSRVERVYGDGNEPVTVFGAGPEPLTLFDPETRVAEEIDPDGSVSKVKFDDRNRVVEEIDPDGAVSRYEYDDRNRIIRQVDLPGGVNELAFDAHGNLVRHTQPLGNVVKAARSGPVRLELADSRGPLNVSEHDAFGNTTRIIRPTGRSTSFRHDRYGRLVGLEVNGQVARKWYDRNGYVVAETDLVGNRTTYERDAFGLLLGWTNPSGRRIDYLHDSDRRLIGARGSDGAECRYEYDSRDRLVLMRLRDGREETFSYDETGLRAAFSGVAGHLTKYTYTPSGQLAEIRSPEGGAVYGYDAGGNCILAECDGHAVGREFTPGERLLAEQQDDFRIEFEYNVAGLVTLRRDSTGRSTCYDYDVRGELARISDSIFGDFEIRRDRLGSMTAIRLANGVVREYEYGADDEISRVIARDTTGAKLNERIYRYAANGELIEATTVGDDSLTFRYDGEYQLIGIAGTAGEVRHFAYDLDHNIVQDSRNGKYRYDGALLRSAGAISYEYDALGRVVARHREGVTARFRYGMGGLIRESLLPDEVRYTYEYDGFGRRVLKAGPGIRVRYFWDQDVLVYEERETSAGTSRIHYLFVPGTFRPLGHAVDGACFFYELDQRSLIREVYDAGGSVVARFDYEAFGDRRTREMSLPEANPPFRLAGQTWDEETGLHYNRFRYFDPETARFLSPDLSVHQIEHNPYAYSPNPINWADPYGLMARFSRADADALKAAQAAENGGFFECSNCGFKNKNKVFNVAKESGRPVGDGSFHAGHKIPHAKGGSANINRNAQVEGGTCNCSKGKRKESGMTCMDKYSDLHGTDKKVKETKKQRTARKKAAKAAMKARLAGGS